MLCVVIKGPTYKEAEEQLKKAHQKADIVELRLDYFESLDTLQLKLLRDVYRIPMIFTLRSKSQGGAYAGDESQRLAHMASLANLKPEYIDLEHDTSPSFIETMLKNHPQVKFILSYHDFQKTPNNLEIILKGMQKVPANLYKIATMAQSTPDALRTLDFIQHSKVPLLMMNMGEDGQITRILRPVFGNGMTYASLDDAQATAPGQLSVDHLLRTFRYKQLKTTTQICGLIGDPVHKSLSHVTHNAVMQAQHLDAVYVKMRVTSGDLNEFFSLVKKLPFRGLSVTMPLKEAILPYLDEIDPLAQKIEAVNTILFEGERLIGYNTDGNGALDAIEEKTVVAGKKVMILGAGGAAKAIAYTAMKRGAHVCILNRDHAKAQKMALELGCSSNSLDQMETEARLGYQILINCTPSPMPIDFKDIIPGSHVMDTNTNPKNSEFLACALEKDCVVTYGYEMFVYQAVAQFERWFKSQIQPSVVKTIIEAEALRML